LHAAIQTALLLYLCNFLPAFLEERKYNTAVFAASNEKFIGSVMQTEIFGMAKVFICFDRRESYRPLQIF
jgi:hypothetical protein